MDGRRGYHARTAFGRRAFLEAALATPLVACSRCGRDPEPEWGVQSGDVTRDAAVIWCRADRTSAMTVEWDRSESFRSATRIAGPRVDPGGDFIGKVRITGLPEDARVHYRARFDDGAWAVGSLRTAPSAPRSVRLAWSGDTNGQGWGIDEARGGMPAYAALLARAPELFIHCGDSIYADGPIPAEIALPDGSKWRNLIEPAKTKVAETLDELRGAHRYPRRSKEVRALSAAVPLLSIWDDHEIRNNWFPGEILDDTRYVDKRVDALMGPARRAFFDYAPTLRVPAEPIHRVVSWGPLVDVFLLDGRTFKTRNDPASPPAPGADSPGAFLGDAQAAWLVDALARSTAVWKLVACNMPLGLVVAEKGKQVPLAFDGYANENGPPSGREHELARILSALKTRGVKNVVWLTADVHYCAAHRFDPARAAFKDFDAFVELVAGPMHALALPRGRLDDTFGPEVVWSSAGEGTFGSPADGAQYFGLLDVDGATRALKVTWVDARGRDLHVLDLLPA